MLRSLLFVTAAGVALAGAAQPVAVKGHGYCYARITGNELVSPLFPWPDVRDISYVVESRWRTYLRRFWGLTDSSLEDCTYSSTLSEAQKFHSGYIRRSGARIVDFDGLPEPRGASPPAKTPQAAEKPAGSAGGNTPEKPAADPELERAAARKQREAEFQAKLEAHEASVADYRAKVAAREAEITRQKREHAAAKDAAARKIEDHRRQLAEASRRQQEYFAAQRRYALCVGGDQKACADIASGKPAAGEPLAGTGQASTDTDANRCVTTAEVRTNASFEGNTAASVMNGCGQPVDVRICLKRASDWNCGTDWGVGPQERASHSSFNATGEVFVDARVAGSNRPLASP